MWPFNKKQPVVATEPTEADLRKKKLFNVETLIEILSIAKQGKQLIIWAYDDIDITNGYVTLFGGKSIFKGSIEEFSVTEDINGNKNIAISNLYSFDFSLFLKHNKQFGF